MEYNNDGICPATFAEWQKKWRENLLLPVNEALPAHIFNNNPALELVLCLGKCALLIVDWPERHFAYVSQSVNSIFGHSPHAFEQGGMAFLESLIMEVDRPTYHRAEEMNFNFLQALPVADRTQARASVNYRIAKPDGTQVQLLQQSTVLSLAADTQAPKYVMLVFSDISHWKEDVQVVASIHAGEHSYSATLPKASELAPIKLLSARERQVLRMLARGLRTPEIAGQLFISENTVEWHRKNILRKLGAKSSSEAVKIGLEKGIM